MADCPTGVLCWLEGSTPSGFEATGCEEVRVRWPGCRAELRQGGVFFEVPAADVAAALTLRSFDKLNVVVYRNEAFNFAECADECAAQVARLVEECDWEVPLACWARVVRSRQPQPDGTVQHSDPVGDGCARKDLTGIIDQALANLKVYTAARRAGRAATTLFGKGDREATLTFRGTCYRSGDGHCFTSQQLQYALGKTLQDAFGFCVDLADHEIEFVLHVWYKRVCVLLPLTRESLHRRNVVDFGYTTLRATICHGLLRVAQPVPGDVVCDPMCGSGAVIAEALGSYDGAGLTHGYLAGDCYVTAVEKTVRNCDAVKQDGCAGACVWDVTQLPLREGSVDVFVTDLPFGKRMNTKQDNRVLYAAMLRELARVARCGTGRAVFLTADSRSLNRAIAAHSALWKQTRALSANVGGLRALVACVRRTDAPSPPKQEKRQTGHRAGGGPNAPRTDGGSKHTGVRATSPAA
eukprot:TRINITY_DN27616_c0_g1_i1.p1 TRINITY_DN27616_c0_g1~~TRINITY_DN27616_c0_g1_i1.p1  ORF type:complete len:491 (+),score=141.96 TRINITY_DN27616_c0_g1_i1:74-1474(+)